jgi:hypothetical protein
MPPISMNSKHWELDSTSADLMVTATPAQAENSDQTPDDGSATPFGESLAWTLVRFHDRFGKSWVPGRIVLRADTLEFRPQRGALVGGELTYVAVRFPEVVWVKVDSRIFRTAVKIAISSGHVISLRCRSAKALADRLVTVIAASRSGAT